MSYMHGPLCRKCGGFISDVLEPCPKCGDDNRSEYGKKLAEKRRKDAEQESDE